MPVAFFPLLLGLAILVTSASGFYLLINARALAAMFNRSSNELAPGPGRRPPTRGRMLATMAVFAAGLLISVLIWSFAGTDTVSNVVESHPERVQRP